MKNSVLLTMTGIFVAVMAGITGYQLQQHKSRPQVESTVVENPYVKPEKTLIGATRPDFMLQDVNGVQRHVREWDGKLLVINFWATWCPPCREEIPAFIKLQDKYADQGVQFVGIALQKAEEVQDFVAELGMNYPVLVGEGAVIKIAEQLGNKFGALPYTVIVDQNQRIVFIKSGPLHYEEADAVINSLL